MILEQIYKNQNHKRKYNRDNGQTHSYNGRNKQKSSAMPPLCAIETSLHSFYLYALSTSSFRNPRGTNNSPAFQRGSTALAGREFLCVTRDLLLAMLTLSNQLSIAVKAQTSLAFTRLPAALSMFSVFRFHLSSSLRLQEIGIYHLHHSAIIGWNTVNLIHGKECNVELCDVIHKLEHIIVERTCVKRHPFNTVN